MVHGAVRAGLAVGVLMALPVNPSLAIRWPTARACKAAIVNRYWIFRHVVTTMETDRISHRRGPWGGRTHRYLMRDMHGVGALVDEDKLEKCHQDT